MKFAIIAAGEGSRLAHEGVAQPKPLVEVCGEHLIDRLIRIFASAGASEVDIICNEQMTAVREHLADVKVHEGVKVNVVVKSTPSSMHSFYELSRYLGDGPFVLTTVDTIFSEEEFSRYIADFKAAIDAGFDGLFGVTDFIDDEKPLYVGIDDEMNINGFFDNRQADSRYISGGIYGLTPKSIDVVKACVEAGESRMRNFQRALIRKDMHLKAWPFTKVLDIDHKADIAKAEHFLTTEA